jgi:hypothetical protein
LIFERSVVYLITIGDRLVINEGSWKFLKGILSTEAMLKEVVKA